MTESIGGRRPVRGTIALDGTRLEAGFTAAQYGTFRARLHQA